MRHWRQVLAMLLAWFMLAIGLGYLPLKRWQRFLIAFLGLQVVALVLVRMTFGPEIGNLFVATVWILATADTYRIAIKEMRIA